MSTFNTAMRIVWRHKSYLLIYLVGLSVMMVAMLLGTVGGGARTADGRPHMLRDEHRSRWWIVTATGEEWHKVCVNICPPAPISSMSTIRRKACRMR